MAKKLKSPPAKRKPADTGPLKIEEGEPSPALKKLLDWEGCLQKEVDYLRKDFYFDCIYCK